MARIYAYRHGARDQKKARTVQFNAAFFDGHVEKLGDLQGADPKMCCKARSTIQWQLRCPTT